MTELETIARAKMYLDKLANGIDPLTDQPVPDGDVVNQVRISRCLFYASDVLRRVLENGGITAPKAPARTAFSISQDQLLRVRFSREPIGIMELCRRITEAAGQENMTRLSPNVILEWLESIGMLEKKMNAEGKQSRRPTETGHQMGIFLAERSSAHGDYIAVLYNEEAQHFIVDNLEPLLAQKR